MPPFTVSRALVLLAFVAFVLAAFGIANVGGILTVPLGLALWAASVLVP